MAKQYRATATFQHASGLPRDQVVNTFAFIDANDIDPADIADEIRDRLGGFYSTLGAHYSSRINLATCTVRVYNMDDPQPRYPFFEELATVTGSTSSANNLPAEVAVVLSFQGAKVSGANMRRRRGRIYLGPLQVTSGDLDQIQSGVFTDVVTAADNYLLHPVSTAATWAVYSPYTHHGIPVGQKLTPDDPEIPGNMPSSFHEVVKFWVDDEWDTQRRRGHAATSRTTVEV